MAVEKEITPAVPTLAFPPQDLEKGSDTDSFKSPGRSHIAPVPPLVGSKNFNQQEAHQIAQADDNIPRQTGLFAPLWRLVVRLSDFGVEARGIERVPEDQRFHTRIFDNVTIWLSVNMAITIFGLGVLGPAAFGLGLKESLATIIVFNGLTHTFVALFAVWGCKTGLRTLPLSRYSFGFWVAYIPVVLNLIATVGWSTVNCIGGVSVLQNVSTTNKIPTAPAVIIVAGLTLIPCFLGYKWIHAYDRYSGILPAVIFIVLLALGMRGFVTTPYAGSGPIEAAKVLSFGATLVGSCFGWASFGADWTVNMPVDTPGWKIFVYVWTGQNAGHYFTEGLGAAYGAALATQPEWAEAYATGDVGGLLRAAFSPAKGFGKFLQVLLCLQIIAGNTPNIYSFCMAFQTLGRYAQAIPRAVIALAMTILYAILAGVGVNTFSSTLTNLIIFLGYWLSNFCIILTLEHFVFRKGKWENYELDEFQNARRLPLGAAAFFAVCLGWVGAVLGMNATWFSGPIAKSIGGDGWAGDIGWQLAMGFGGLAYLPARYIEKKYWGF